MKRKLGQLGFILVLGVFAAGYWVLRLAPETNEEYNIDDPVHFQTVSQLLAISDAKSPSSILLDEEYALIAQGGAVNMINVLCRVNLDEEEKIIAKFKEGFGLAYEQANTEEMRSLIKGAVKFGQEAASRSIDTGEFERSCTAAAAFSRSLAAGWSELMRSMN